MKIFEQVFGKILPIKWSFTRNLLLAGFCLFLLGSCGYRFGRGDFVENYHTISVPYVEGDDQGELTNAIIYQIAAKGVLRYEKFGGNLILNVCLFEPTDDNIGFIYSTENDGSRSRVLAANEARLSILAKVSVTDASSGRIVIGPINIASTITYDFEPDYRRFNAHSFSLGQLETHNIAQIAAFRPLYKQLAEKIVDYVSHSW